MVYSSQKLKAAPAQAAVMIVLAVVVVVLGLYSASNSNMALMNSKRNIVDISSIQTYYVANAGIQEALATRMVPRSNFLNFVTKDHTAPYYDAPDNLTDLPSAVTPMYPESGLLFRDFNTSSTSSTTNSNTGVTKKGLMGVYRYVIVGGDPSRNPDKGGSYYENSDLTSNLTANIPRLLTTNTSPWNGSSADPGKSPFYIISMGTTCINDIGKNSSSAKVQVGVDQFQSRPNGTQSVSSANELILSDNPNNTSTNQASVNIQGNPQCKPGYKPFSITLVATVAIEPETNDDIKKLDRIISVQSFGPNDVIRLSGTAFIPNVGWFDSIHDFNSLWGYTASDPYKRKEMAARPQRVVFFNFGTNEIYQNFDLDKNNNQAREQSLTPDTKIPINASIMIYFDGPIDYRSLSSDINSSGNLYDKNLSGCKNPNVSNCAIQLFSSTDPNHPQTSMQVIPNLPYSTKVLLLPPLGYQLDGNNTYTLKIYTDKIRGFNYQPGPLFDLISPATSANPNGRKPLELTFKTGPAK